MPALGLQHTNPSSYHPSKTTNGEQNGSHGHATGANGEAKQTKESLPKVRVLPNTASVEEVVEAMKVGCAPCILLKVVLIRTGSWRLCHQECRDR